MPAGVQAIAFGSSPPSSRFMISSMQTILVRVPPAARLRPAEDTSREPMWLRCDVCKLRQATVEDGDRPACSCARCAPSDLCFSYHPAPVRYQQPGVAVPNKALLEDFTQRIDEPSALSAPS